MSLCASRWAWMQQGLRPVQKLVLLALADRADAHDMAFPSYECLKFDTGLDRKTIWLALKELEEAELIIDSGEKKGKTKSITVWKLNGVEQRNGEGSLKAERVSSSKNGKTKQFQKRNSSENGIVPFFPRSSSKNGKTKQFQKRNMEPINSEPIKEPIKKINKKKIQDEKLTPDSLTTFAASPPVSASKPTSKKIDIDTVFAYWQAVMRHPQAKLNDKREKAIQSAFKLGYTVHDIKQAIDGCTRSAFHMGDNETSSIYDDLHIVIRNIDKFIELAERKHEPNQQRHGIDWLNTGF